MAIEISPTDALIVVDIQYDFCPGGALPVKNGDEVIPLINRLTPKFPLVVATRDWHAADHGSFASQHEGFDPLDVVNLDGIEQELWPDHCVAGTRGAEFHHELDQAPFHAIFHKGVNRDVDSYSALLENDHWTETGLRGYLEGLGVKRIFVCGLATDFCVRFTVLDALQLGFEAVVIRDACRGVDIPDGTADKAFQEMRQAGALVLTSNEI
jgi:nicotinamidase/pyrazinamidase